MSDETFGPVIDTKYEFLAWKAGTLEKYDPITEAEGLVFRAKDNALLPTLRFYREECERIGVSAGQLISIDLLIERVEKWREMNPERCKVPD